MQELQSQFEVVDGRNQALRKEVKSLRSRLSQVLGDEIALPSDGFQSRVGWQVLPWSQRVLSGWVEATGPFAEGNSR
eukprot:1595972-Amphidinium_carterae.1